MDAEDTVDRRLLWDIADCILILYDYWEMFDCVYNTEYNIYRIRVWRNF